MRVVCGRMGSVKMKMQGEERWTSSWSRPFQTLIVRGESLARSAISPVSFMSSNGMRISHTDKDGMKFISLIIMPKISIVTIYYNLQIALSPTYTKMRVGLYVGYN